MVLRQRTISMGYFDYQICRFVQPMTLDLAARHLDIRHRILTGESQHIEKKTLDDYYGYVKSGHSFTIPYEFNKNKDKPIKLLRSHCISTKIEKQQSGKSEKSSQN